jgi:hypothetical protein
VEKESDKFMESLRRAGWRTDYLQERRKHLTDLSKRRFELSPLGFELSAFWTSLGHNLSPEASSSSVVFDMAGQI